VKIHVLTLFPELIEPYFLCSIMKRAVEKEIIEYSIVNIRDFAFDKHKNCDDYPYGGGAGMVMKPEPLAGALDRVNAVNLRTIFPTPSGKLFDQNFASSLTTEKELVFICGRYEGIDQRIIDLYVDDEVSIGDYVLSSGEIAALTIIDSVYRLLDGVISAESLDEESFVDGVLEYPQYTRPEVFREQRVPDVLMSGHHERIRSWRREKSLRKTALTRPELLKGSEFEDFSIQEQE
jgi:tRNA (guanine37-N1)-methyltransferase